MVRFFTRFLSQTQSDKCLEAPEILNIFLIKGFWTLQLLSGGPTLHGVFTFRRSKLLTELIARGMDHTISVFFRTTEEDVYHPHLFFSK